jgi:hypothetical protein
VETTKKKDETMNKNHEPEENEGMPQYQHCPCISRSILFGVLKVVVHLQRGSRLLLRMLVDT